MNNKEMQSTESEKYLGDMINTSCKLDENIAMRHYKGMGIVNYILSILKEISMLVNGILFSTEALSNISQSNINLLEECDKKLMRKLFEAKQGTPIEAFYFETAAWPFCYIILGRHLMYYWFNLRKNEKDLVKFVFNAQRDFRQKKPGILRNRIP